MKQNVLKEKSFLFAVRIVRLSQWLTKEKSEFVLSKQILRSGTAMGALISEALLAQSKPNFVSKLSTLQKEANETNYWIELLAATDYIENDMRDSLTTELNEIIDKLISGIKTGKETNNEK